MVHLLKTARPNYHYGEQKANIIFRLMFAYFDAPVFAGSRLIFHAAISGGTHGEGIFRIASSPQPPPVPVEALAWLGGPAPDGGSFVAFGDPAGNTAGNVALTADLSGSAVPRAILVFP